MKNLLNFGEALDVLKVGGKVCRSGWNGKGMYVKKEKLGTLTTEIDNPCLIIKNVQGNFNTWIPSITDLFADDWEVV